MFTGISIVEFFPFGRNGSVVPDTLACGELMAQPYILRGMLQDVLLSTVPPT